MAGNSQTTDRKWFGRHWQNGFLAGVLWVAGFIAIGVAMGVLRIGQ